MIFSVPVDKHIGVMISGGMDSALLLYLVAQQHPQKITTFTVPKHDGASLYVDDVVDWINEKLQLDIPYSILTGNPDLPHSEILNNALPQIEHLCDVFYLGGNIYPKDILPGGPNRVRRKHPKMKQPFFHLFKTDLLQMYLDLDILELSRITHTCTEWSVGRCQQCWQCKERIWAFTTLGIEDLTTV